MKIAFIDHYDSFSFNVLDWLFRAGLDESDVLFARCDDKNALEHVKKSKIPLVLSPGPHHPKDLSLSLDLVRTSIDHVPILGVCLGHQLLGFASGASVVPAKNPWHGSRQEIRILSQEAIFAGLPSKINVACYNSLTVDRLSMERHQHWNVLAENQDGEIMAMMKNDTAVATWSVQFHPESFMSEYGNAMAVNWLRTL